MSIFWFRVYSSLVSWIQNFTSCSKRLNRNLGYFIVGQISFFGENCSKFSTSVIKICCQKNHQRCQFVSNMATPNMTTVFWITKLFSRLLIGRSITKRYLSWWRASTCVRSHGMSTILGWHTPFWDIFRIQPGWFLGSRHPSMNGLSKHPSEAENLKEMVV